MIDDFNRQSAIPTRPADRGAGGNNRKFFKALFNRQSAIGNRQYFLAGQSLLEYAILLMAIIGTAIVMLGFVRGAVSHMMKGAADTFGQGMLYRP